jgi:hypothetical protein
MELVCILEAPDGETSGLRASFLKCQTVRSASLPLARLKDPCKCKTVVFYYILVLTLSDPMSDFVRHYDFPVPDTFPHVEWTLANR